LCVAAWLVFEITTMSGYRHQCWDFRGAVSEPSEICAEEKRVSKNGAANGTKSCFAEMASGLCSNWLNCAQVLGHHLSKGATALFQTAQVTASWSVKVLPSLEEDNTMHKLRPEIEHNIEQYLMRCDTLTQLKCSIVNLQMAVGLIVAAALHD